MASITYSVDCTAHVISIKWSVRFTHVGGQLSAAPTHIAEIKRLFDERFNIHAPPMSPVYFKVGICVVKFELDASTDIFHTGTSHAHGGVIR